MEFRIVNYYSRLLLNNTSRAFYAAILYLGIGNKKFSNYTFIGKETLYFARVINFVIVLDKFNYNNITGI